MPQATLALGVIVAVSAPLAALLVPIVFGEAFADAADPLVILLAAWLIRAVASLAAPVLMLHERSGATAAINLVALAINVVGDLILVGLLGAGVIGPAVASAVAMVPIAVGYLVVAGRSTGTRARIPASALLAPAVAIAATLALPLAAAFGIAVAASVAGIALAASTGLFSAQDADLVERLRLPAALKRRLIGALLARG